MSDLLSNLNPEQIQAVTYTGGPLMIVAGAGTGKTTVITRRIAWLIEQGHAKPEQILALTFTDKAAGEMEERVDLLLPYGYADLQISTFHAFCEKLLRDYGINIGLSRDFKPLTELDAWLLTRSHFDRFDLDYYRPLGNPTKYLRSLLTHFSRAKDAGITATTYLDYATSKQADLDSAQADEETTFDVKREVELARAFHTYQQVILEHDGLDFGDLILFSLKLLRDRPQVLAQVRKRYEFLLVDEFQDTNGAQYELVKLLTGDQQNVTVVGDDDQAIYKFRGASLTNILEFEKDFPSCKKIVLKTNYRSGQEILDKAYAFIQKNNPNRLEAQVKNISKQLLAHCDAKGFVEHIHCSTLEEEVQTVVKKIITLKQDDQSVQWNDFAILVRSNAAGKDFVRELEKQNVPYQFLALSGLYTKPIILDAMALLRVIDNPHESPSMYRVLSMSLWNIEQSTISELNHLAKQKGKSLAQAIELSRGSASIDPSQALNLENVLSILSRLRQEVAKRSASDMLVHTAKETGWYRYLLDLRDERQKKELFGYLQSLFQRVRGFETRSDHMDLHSFLLEFEHERSAGEEGSLSVDPEAGPDMVRILTVHSAKGLEFRYVFVVNLIDRRFPTQRRADGISLPLELTDQPETDSEQHLQEERRLFYVAMTRAKEGLFLTSANDYGGARARKLSRFLHELDFEKPVQSAQTFINALDQDADPVSSSNTNDFHNASPNHFSFTQLVAFRTCPLQYKFAHVLKIPLFGKWTTSFGKTMHATLQRFFELWMERQQSKQTELFSESSDDQRNKKNNLVPVSLSELLELYEQSWHDDWYTNDDQREKYRTRGHDQLKTLYATFAEEVPRPLGLEQAFTVKVGDVILKGRIDRMDRFDGGIEIIDYKTGSPKQEGDVKLSDKEQLFLYQIAAQEVLGLIPKRLTFHYLEDNSRVSFLGSEKQIEALKKQINDRAKAISQSDFEPTPGFHCNYCDFKEICPFRQS